MRVDLELPGLLPETHGGRRLVLATGRPRRDMHDAEPASVRADDAASGSTPDGRVEGGGIAEMEVADYVFREGGSIEAVEGAGPTRVTLRVYGTPAAKGSSRPMLNRKTGKAFTFRGGSKTSEIKIDTWDANVRARAAALTRDGREGPWFIRQPLEVRLAFFLCRPAGHFRANGTLKPSAPCRPIMKPDGDKLARLVLDAITGSVVDDDSRVARLVVDKQWATADQSEGAWISVEVMR